MEETLETTKQSCLSTSELDMLMPIIVLEVRETAWVTMADRTWAPSENGPRVPRHAAVAIAAARALQQLRALVDLRARTRLRRRRVVSVSARSIVLCHRLVHGAHAVNRVVVSVARKAAHEA